MANHSVKKEDKNIIIMGSTGMIGSIILKEAIASKEINKILLINKKPSGILHKKITEIIHDDFLDFSSIASSLRHIDIAYYCIGVYTGSVPADEFRMITVDILEAFSSTIKKVNPHSTFCLLSAAGADQSQTSKIMFARDKGAAENIILEHCYDHHYFFRPGYIYPSTKRKEPNFMYKIMRTIYPLFKYIIPNASITSEELARALFITGVKGNKKSILNNKDMKSIAHQYVI